MILATIGATLWASGFFSNGKARQQGSFQSSNSNEPPISKQVSGAPLNELWSKTNTPKWAAKLAPKVRTAFAETMTDESPLYTALLCNGKSTKVYVNRSEWKKLTKFQATNNLMLAVLLPHTDDTVIEYLDDKSGEQLATFTPKQKLGSIKVVHP